MNDKLPTLYHQHQYYVLAYILLSLCCHDATGIATTTTRKRVSPIVIDTVHRPVESGELRSTVGEFPVDDNFE
eukprot:288123-Ditylum_brightwellii.AAC.1